MGLKILEEIESSSGTYHIDTYSTISSVYKIEKRNEKIYLCSSANIYVCKNAYMQKKVPLIFHVRLEIEVSLDTLQNEDLYRLLYDCLKDRIRDRFGLAITFEDDL